MKNPLSSVCPCQFHKYLCLNNGSKEPRNRIVRCVTLAGARAKGLDNNIIIIRWCVVAGLRDLTAADAVACRSFPSDCLQADDV